MNNKKKWKDDFQNLLDFIYDLLTLNKEWLLKNRPETEIQYDFELMKKTRHVEKTEEILTELIQRWINVLNIEKTEYYKNYCSQWKEVLKINKWEKFNYRYKNNLTEIHSIWIENIKRGFNG